MKQITVISGKGGTGKTTLVASFAALADNKVLADCDVDAADLHLILKPNVSNRTEFRNSKEAVINTDLCSECGLCEEYCRFEAITDLKVDPIACEGCELCKRICPDDAIEMKISLTGEWFISETQYGSMVHAKLGIGEENSGKLVAIVRNESQKLAADKQSEYVIIDGPPGIGCPVISSITGVDIVVVVTEPSISGIHDLKRVVDTAAHFQIPALVVINKCDINPEVSDQIEAYCKENNCSIIGKIPFDPVFVDALVNELPVVEYSKNGISAQIKNIWNEVQERIR